MISAPDRAWQYRLILRISCCPPPKITNLLQLSFSGNTLDNDVELPLAPYYGYIAQLQADNMAHDLAIGLSLNKLLSVHIPRDYANGVISIRYKAPACSTPFLYHFTRHCNYYSHLLHHKTT